MKISIRAHDLSIVKENLTPQEASEFLNRPLVTIYKASKVCGKLEGYIVSRQSTEYLILIERLKQVSKDKPQANEVLKKAIKELDNG